jgi:hypothetical protein
MKLVRTIGTGSLTISVIGALVTLVGAGVKFYF